MAFAQLTYRKSPRDIKGNLRAQARRLHHKQPVGRAAITASK